MSMHSSCTLWNIVMFSQIRAQENGTHNGKKSRTERKITRGMRKEEGHRRETLMRKHVGKWNTQLCDFTEYQISHEDTEQWKKDQRLAIKTASERCLDSQKQPCSPESTIASVGCFTWVKQKGLFYHPHNESPRETADVKDMQDFYLLECYALLLAGWIDGSFKQIEIKEKVSQTPLIP